MSRLAAAVAGIVLALLLSACTARPAAQETTVGTPLAPNVLTELPVEPAALSTTQLTELLDRFRSDRIQVVSTVVNWNAVRPRASEPYQWDEVDTLVRLALERGLQVRLRVSGTPRWLHPNLTGVSEADAMWYPPTGAQELDTWAGFLTDLTTRYGSRIAGIEIWNEPNESWFWKPSPDPRAYAALLRTSYLAIKRVAPGLTVTSGGLSHNDIGYLSRFYDAAATYPDARGNHWYFDQLGLHPYSADRSPDASGLDTRHPGPFGVVDESFTGMRDMAALVEQREGVRKHVWISEFGYSTASTHSSVPGIPDGRRAYFLTRAFALAQADGYVDGLAWYHSHPSPWDPPGYDILPAKGTTETYAALTRVTGAKPATSPLALPLPSELGRDVQPITSSGAGPEPLAGMEFYLDGRLVATGTKSLAWDTRAAPAGRQAVQLVSWSHDGTTYTSPVQTVSIQH